MRYPRHECRIPRPWIFGVIAAILSAALLFAIACVDSPSSSQENRPVITNSTTVMPTTGSSTTTTASHSSTSNQGGSTTTGSSSSTTTACSYKSATLTVYVRHNQTQNAIAGATVKVVGPPHTGVSGGTKTTGSDGKVHFTKGLTRTTDSGGSLIYCGDSFQLTIEATCPGFSKSTATTTLTHTYPSATKYLYLSPE